MVSAAPELCSGAESNHLVFRNLKGKRKVAPLRTPASPGCVGRNDGSQKLH